MPDDARGAEFVFRRRRKILHTARPAVDCAAMPLRKDLLPPTVTFVRYVSVLLGSAILAMSTERALTP
jgi:hypothetical protein